MRYNGRKKAPKAQNGILVAAPRAGPPLAV
jgi:hypothetical protein